MYTHILQSLFFITQRVLLAVDPYLWVPLEKEMGKRVLLSIHQLGDFGLELHSKEINLIEVTQHNKAQQTYHCSIQGSLTAFLDLILKERRFMPGNGITLLGDFQLAQSFFQCFMSMDPDWAHLWAERIPKPLSAFIHTLFKPLVLEMQEWNLTRQKDLQAFLVDELQALPSRAAMLDLENQIAALNRQSQYLEAQFAHLQQTFNLSQT